MVAAEVLYTFWALLFSVGHLHLCLQAGFLVAAWPDAVAIWYSQTTLSRGIEGFYRVTVEERGSLDPRNSSRCLLKAH